MREDSVLFTLNFMHHTSLTISKHLISMKITKIREKVKNLIQKHLYVRNWVKDDSLLFMFSTPKQRVKSLPPVDSDLELG